MPTVIYYQRYSLESTKRAINWILIPVKVMTLSWGTVKFKLDKKYFLYPLIMCCKLRYHIVSIYVKYIKNWPNEERVGF